MKSVTLASQLYVSIHNPSPKALTVEPPTTPMAFPALPGRACTDLCGSPESYSQPEKDLLSYIYQGSQDSSLETQKTLSPASLPLVSLLCLSNMDIQDLTRIREDSSVFKMESFRRTEVSDCVSLYVYRGVFDKLQYRGYYLIQTLEKGD